MKEFIETKNLSKRFDGVHAIDGLSIAIDKGVITGVIGPNGSGKSTLVNVISGMMPFEGGALVVGGEHFREIEDYEVADLGITRTFQEVRLFNQMTVFDNILVVLTKRGVFESLFETNSKFHEERAKELLEMVGLWDKRHALAVNLSYGQRKLLEIGRALAMSSEVYLFDEPFAGLFPEMIKRIVAIMHHLKDAGKTVVLIEHNMQLIRELCDHLFVLDSGKLLAAGKPNEVLERRDVAEAYLGE